VANADPARLALDIDTQLTAGTRGCSSRHDNHSTRSERSNSSGLELA
jgi:hypothetical protein